MHCIWDVPVWYKFPSLYQTEAFYKFITLASDHRGFQLVKERNVATWNWLQAGMRLEFSHSCLGGISVFLKAFVSFFHGLAIRNKCSARRLQTTLCVFCRKRSKKSKRTNKIKVWFVRYVSCLVLDTSITNVTTFYWSRFLCFRILWCIGERYVHILTRFFKWNCWWRCWMEMLISFTLVSIGTSSPSSIILIDSLFFFLFFERHSTLMCHQLNKANCVRTCQYRTFLDTCKIQSRKYLGLHTLTTSRKSRENFPNSPK